MQTCNRCVFIVVLVLLLAVSMPVVAQDDAWVPVTGADTLPHNRTYRNV